VLPLVAQITRCTETEVLTAQLNVVSIKYVTLISALKPSGAIRSKTHSKTVWCNTIQNSF